MFRSALGKTLGFAGYTIQYGCIAHCAFEYIGEFVACSGPSMEPTITSHDIVFSERLSHHLCRIENGDIVITKSPFDPHMSHRFGGRQSLHQWPLGYLQDPPIRWQVLSSHIDGEMDKLAYHLLGVISTVPKGHVWLEGDNLRNSTDSRSYGPVPYALIRGRVYLKLWPLHHFGAINQSPTGRVIKRSV